MRIAGIPIVVHRSWYVVAGLITWSLATGYFPLRHPGSPALLYWVMGFSAALLLFLCVLLHELGHSLVARGHGIPVHQVTLFLFGGVATIGREAHRPWVELQVALAGPLVSAALAAGGFLLDIHAPAASGVWWRAVVRYLAAVNVGIILFNLLPGFPLDGGRVLRALLWLLTGDVRRATRIASFIGMALGLGLIALGALEAATRGLWSGGLWLVLLGGYLHGVAYSIYRAAAR